MAHSLNLLVLAGTNFAVTIEKFAL